MKEHRILNKAKFILETNKGDTSIYYKELKKSVKDYKELKNKDKTTIDLYLEHISNLCELLDEKKNANRTILMVILTFIIMIFLTFYSTLKYYEMEYKLKDNIIKASNNTSLVVEYKNLDDFNALVFSDSDDFKSLKPLTLSITGTSKDNKKRKMRYNVYIIEQNTNINNDELLPRDAFKYHVSNGTKESEIKSLSKSTIENDRILIYSSEIECGHTDELSIRLWIDSETNVDYLNKKYNFKMYVDGYEI